MKRDKLCLSDEKWTVLFPSKRGKRYYEEIVFQLYLDNQINQNHLYQKQFLHRRSFVSLPKTSSLPEQKKQANPVPPHSTSDQTEDDLIPCPYDLCISYERIWGTNVPIMDYDIFKLQHPFSMLVAGPQGAGKSEFVKQLLSLKRFIMTNPPERIVLFYGRHQHLFCSLEQEIPCIEFYEGLPTSTEIMFDRNK